MGLKKLKRLNRIFWHPTISVSVDTSGANLGVWKAPTVTVSMPLRNKVSQKVIPKKS